MPIYYTAPRLQRMNKNASETMCFDGSGAASGATVCGAGNTLDEWGCANGAENADSPCGAGGATLDTCVLGASAANTYSSDSCWGGSGNLSCGSGSMHLPGV